MSAPLHCQKGEGKQVTGQREIKCDLVTGIFSPLPLLGWSGKHFSVWASRVLGLCSTLILVFSADEGPDAMPCPVRFLPTDVPGPGTGSNAYNE